MDNIPDALYLQLADFPTKMGRVADRTQRNQKADKFSHM